MKTTIEEQAKKLAERALAREKYVKEAIKEQMEVPNKSVSTTQNMTYFKKHYESCDKEWTVYGCYKEQDITPSGDILCVVDEIEMDPEKSHIQHDVNQDYFEEDEITQITRSEYNEMLNKVKKAEEYLNKADSILKTLL